MVILILLGILILLQIADAWTTVKVLKHGYEKNKLLAKLMDKIGVIPALIVSKVVGMGIIIGGIWLALDLGRNIITVVLILFIGYYIKIVMGNLNELKKDVL